jgi:5-methylcytosine-specific restriction endonuclease McrA
MQYVLDKVKQRNIKKYGELTCELCGATIEHEVFHYDHIIPVSKFSRTLTPFRMNSVRNLQITCESCNLKKSNIIPKEKFKTI